MSDEKEKIEMIEIETTECISLMSQALEGLEIVRDFSLNVFSDQSNLRLVLVLSNNSTPQDFVEFLKLENFKGYDLEQIDFTFVSHIPYDQRGFVLWEKLSDLTYFSLSDLRLIDELNLTSSEFSNSVTVVQEYEMKSPLIKLDEKIKSPLPFSKKHSQSKIETASDLLGFKGKESIVNGVPIEEAFLSATTLQDCLYKARKDPKKGLKFVDLDGSLSSITYAQLEKEALQILTGLKSSGLRKGDFLIFQFDSSMSYLKTFWACIFGGIIPAPVAMPNDYEASNSALEKLIKVKELLDNALVITDRYFELFAYSQKEAWEQGPINFESVATADKSSEAVDLLPTDSALILFTSGSTGTPKGVLLNHKNILAMSAGTIQINQLDSNDLTLNWMPLDHVGAIVFLSCLAVDLGVDQIHVPTDYILEEPLRWLDLIQDNKATMSWAPNFAFSLINDRQEEIQQKQWNLSSMHFLVNAGEQISSKSARKFLDVLAPHQLPAEAIVPAFGMSETCSGISWSLDFRSDGGDIDNFVSLGPPIPGSSFRIVDDQGAVLPEGRIGHFELQGPSLFNGYYKRDDLNAKVFLEDSWFHTGDLGFLKDNNLYLTGRNKDDIIINGVNFFSHEIEQTLEELSDIEVSYVAACPIKLVNEESEKLAIFVNPVGDNMPTSLQRKIQAHLLDKLGLVPDFILALPKAEFPKTGIGKIQKSKLRENFEKGSYVDILRSQGHRVDFPNIIEKEFFRPGWVKRDLAAIQNFEVASKVIYCFHLGESSFRDMNFDSVKIVHCFDAKEFERFDEVSVSLDFSREDHIRDLLSNQKGSLGAVEILINVDGYSNESLKDVLSKLHVSMNVIKNKIQGLRFLGRKGNVPSDLLNIDYLAKQECFVGNSLVQVLQIAEKFKWQDLDLETEFSSKILCPYVSHSNNGRKVLLLKAYQELSAVQFSSPFFSNSFTIDQLEGKTVVITGTQFSLIDTLISYLKSNLDLTVIYCGNVDKNKCGSFEKIDRVIKSEAEWLNFNQNSNDIFCHFEIFGKGVGANVWTPNVGTDTQVFQVYSYNLLCGHSSLHQYGNRDVYQFFLDSDFSIDSASRDLAEVLYFLEQEEHHLVSTPFSKACRLGTLAHPIKTNFQIKSFIESDDLVLLLDKNKKIKVKDHELSIEMVSIEKYPLNYKGQIDYKGLSKGRLKKNDQTLGASAVAKKIEKVWKSVLNLEEVPYDETFFELGGHSLLIAKTQGLLEKELDQKITILELFKYPTIGEFSKYILDSNNKDMGSHLYGLARAKVRESVHQKIAKADIAVIGMACRYPGANDVESFWENLKEGKETISFFTKEEAKEAGVHSDWYDKDQYVFAAPVIDDVDMFDAEFFGISGRDADLMDPQQRVAIEVAWETLERAGVNPKTYDGSIGVYAGAGMNTYLINNVIPNRNNLVTKNSLEVYNLDSLGGFQIMITNDKDYISTRISYCLDLKGPSVNVQTACSTSLVAIHMASQSILSGESDMALAGGVSVKVPQKTGYSHAEGMIVAADGHCKAFDEKADGTIFGSGCGFVLLKSLDKALEDGDHIHAVIKGTSFNNDGGAKIGFAAPSENGESSAIAEAITISGVSADTIGYVETHGTGTELGDPIEVSSLTSAFRETTHKKAYCPIGSVKSNVGHLQIASGIVGFMKSALSVENGLVPPSLHFQTPNPKIQFSSSPFYVNTKLSEWSLPGPRRAGVNSLGIGGANTHAILEEADCHLNGFTRDLTKEKFGLLTISARNEKSLKASIKNYIKYLESTNDDYRDICYTSNIGRVHFDVRVSVFGESKADLIEKLKKKSVIVLDKKIKKIGLVFSGQGSQYPAMAKSLYFSNAGFRQDFDKCDQISSSYLKRSLKNLLLNGTEKELAQTDFTQPVLFALEVCLAKYWLRLGLEPQILLGHSLGEYAAACIAGIFSLEDGLKLVLRRSQLMSTLPEGGGMLAVACGEEELHEKIKIGNLNIAAINGPEALVLSGDQEKIRELEAELKGFGIRCKKLDVSHAFHSNLMQPMLGEYKGFLDETEFDMPKYDLISNVTAKTEVDAFIDSQYWIDHILDTVQFSKSVEVLFAEKLDAVLEIGPQATLLGMISALNLEGLDKTIILQPSLRSNVDSEEHLLEAIVKLYEAGQNFKWEAFHSDHIRQRVILPTYAFQKNSHWIEAPKAGLGFSVESNASLGLDRLSEAEKVLGTRIDSPVLKSSLYDIDLGVKRLPYLKEHEVFDVIVVPGAGHISMLLEVCKDQFGLGAYRLQDLVFPSVLILDSKDEKKVQLSVSKSNPKLYDFQLISELDQEDYKLHCSGALSAAELKEEWVDLLAIKEKVSTVISISDFYAGFDKRKIDLGPLFRWVGELWCNEGASLAKMKLPNSFDSKQKWMIHPGLLDSTIQILMASIELTYDETLIPFSMDSYEYFGTEFSTEIYSYFEKTSESDDGMITGDVLVFNGEGKVISKVSGFKVRRINQELVLKEIKKQKNIPIYALEQRTKILEEEPSEAIGDKEITDTRILVLCKTNNIEVKTSLKKLYSHKTNTLAFVSADSLASELEKTKGQVFDELVYFCPAKQEGLPDLYAAIDQVRLIFETLLKNEQLVIDARIALLNLQEDVGYLGQTFRSMVNALSRVLQLESPSFQIRSMQLNKIENLKSALLSNNMPSNECSWSSISGKESSEVKWDTLASVASEDLKDKPFDNEGAFVVTGAYGGLGQKTIEALVEEGVRDLILISRSEPSAANQNDILKWKSEGIAVETIAVDVAEAKDLELHLNASFDKIKGIFHCAGILDDSLLIDSSRESFENVYLSKVKGTFTLHELSQKMIKLKYFVNYSSISSVFGAVSQGAYGSANAFIDGLMALRKNEGLPGLSLNWGPWAEVGMASGLSESEQDFWRNKGFRFLDSDACKKSLITLLNKDSNDLPSQLLLADVNWNQLSKSVPNAIFENLITENSENEAVEICRLIEEAEVEDRFEILDQYIQDEVAVVLGIKNSKEIDSTKGLTDLGLDSLAAVDLKGRLEHGLKVALKATLAFDYPTLEALIAYIAEDVLPYDFKEAVEPAESNHVESEDDLEDEDIAEALARQLAELEEED